MEWENPENKPFFMAVQWHPERMDTLNPLSMPLMKAFLEAATIKSKKK
jgi:gamma-glutamyl-gamma-aminobutyrate hydrolase PuuD